ncbi:MAG: transposase, partial [Tannerella sp.]|nr:transposase [Tannerella sp.]
MSARSINPVKSKYKIRNRKACNSNLCQRGSMTVFLSPDVLETWNLLVNRKKEAGGVTYPDSIVQCCLLLKIQPRPPLSSRHGLYKKSVHVIGQGVF